MLSGATGQIDTVDCYDFSIYGGEGGAQDYINSGMSVQYTARQKSSRQTVHGVRLGTDRDDQFVRERYLRRL